jgi:hypothetical protein
LSKESLQQLTPHAPRQNMELAEMQEQHEKNQREVLEL